MVHGKAHISFDARRGRTALGEVYQSDPLRVLFPDTGGEEPLTGVMITTSGGLVSGDRLEINVVAGANTESRIMAQAAEKIYRSTGTDTQVDIRLKADSGAWLEWLPQETILFESARLQRTTTVEVAAGAQALLGEMIVFGRTAHGERMTQGLLRESWNIYQSGRLSWRDALHLDCDLEQVLQASAGFDGASSCASMIYVGEDAAAQQDAVRECVQAQCNDSLHAATSCLNEVLVTRWLGRDSLQLRQAYGVGWSELRHRLAGYPPIMPSLWHI